MDHNWNRNVFDNRIKDTTWIYFNSIFVCQICGCKCVYKICCESSLKPSFNKMVTTIHMGIEIKVAQYHELWAHGFSRLLFHSFGRSIPSHIWTLPVAEYGSIFWHIFEERNFFPIGNSNCLDIIFNCPQTAPSHYFSSPSPGS